MYGRTRVGSAGLWRAAWPRRTGALLPKQKEKARTGMSAPRNYAGEGARATRLFFGIASVTRRRSFAATLGCSLLFGFFHGLFSFGSTLGASFGTLLPLFFL